jgi:hypothetical protein
MFVDHHGAARSHQTGTDQSTAICWLRRIDCFGPIVLKNFESQML